MVQKQRSILLTAVVLIGLLLLALNLNIQWKTRLTVFHAGSLAAPMRDLAQLFEQRNPSILVVREASGSRMAARKTTQLGRTADVLAVSDYLVIEELVMPRHADWYVEFGRNRIVLAYTERSVGAAEIDPRNWFEILLTSGTEYGHSDPNLDPCGYRTLMAWELAETYYGRPGLFEELEAGRPPGNVRPSEVELLPLLESMDLDYVFNYESVARQHHLQYVRLPPEIDLGDPEMASLYADASMEVTGKEPGRLPFVGRAQPLARGHTGGLGHGLAHAHRIGAVPGENTGPARCGGLVGPAGRLARIRSRGLERVDAEDAADGHHAVRAEQVRTFASEHAAVILAAETESAFIIRGAFEDALARGWIANLVAAAVRVTEADLVDDTA